MATKIVSSFPNMLEVQAIYRGRVELALEGIKEEIITEAKRQVPYDEGYLSDSIGGEVVKTSTGAEVHVWAGADGDRDDGGSSKDYATIQHENLDFYHPGGRKAKYLTDPMEAVGRLGFAKYYLAAARGLTFGKLSSIARRFGR